MPARSRRYGSWLAILLQVLAAVVVGPVARASSLRIAVAMAVAGGGFSMTRGPGNTWTVTSCDGRDPWGRPLCAVPGSGMVPKFYSMGANGRDDGASGDDVVPTTAEEALGGVLGRAPFSLVNLALLVAWLTWGPYVARPRVPRLRTELGRAAVLASGPLVLLYLAFAPILGLGPIYDIYLSGVWRRFASESTTAVPFEVALGGTPVLVGWILALAWRLRRPQVPPCDSPAEPAAANEFTT